MKLSDEQEFHLSCVEKGYNVWTQAVAGAGKTTTLLLFAKRHPKKRCLMMTYSKKLQEDVNKRCQLEGITNVFVYTYHGAASAYFQTLIHDDQTFINILKKTREKLKTTLTSELKIPMEQNNKFNCDVLLLDEVQDLCPLYWYFLDILIKQNDTCQLCLCGDPRQTIYIHQGANSDFLTKCQELFFTYYPSPESMTLSTLPKASTTKVPISSAASTISTQSIAPKVQTTRKCREWKTGSLSVSYRLTPATAQVVNRHILNLDTSESSYVKGGNTKVENLRPMYLATKYGTAVPSIALEVQRCIAEYGRENVVILAPTVRNIQAGNKSFLAKLIHDHLFNVPMHVAIKENDQINDEKQSKDKLLITTFHSMKGCERDCVIVMSFDSSYFEFYDKTYKDFQGALPNILYVAATRAKKELILVADEKRTFWTIDETKLFDDFRVCTYNTYKKRNDILVKSAFTKFKLTKPNTSSMLESEALPMNVELNDLLRHLDSETIFKMRQLIDVKLVDLKQWMTPSTATSSEPTASAVINAGPNPPMAAVPKIQTRLSSNNSGKREYKSHHFTRLETTTTIPFSSILTPEIVHHENVSDFYQLVLVAIAEVNKNKTSHFGNDTHDIEKYYSSSASATMTVPKRQKRETKTNGVNANILKSYPETFWGDCSRAYQKVSLDRSPQEWMQLAVATSALTNGKHHLARQITHYNWVDVNYINQMVVRMLIALKPLSGVFMLPSSKIVAVENASSFNSQSKKQNVSVMGTCQFLSSTLLCGSGASTSTSTTLCGGGAAPATANPNLYGVWEFKCGQVKDEVFLKVACLCVLAQSQYGYVLSLGDNTLYQISLKATPRDGKTQSLLRCALGKYSKHFKVSNIHEVLAQFAKTFFESNSQPMITDTTPANEMFNLGPKIAQPVYASTSTSFTLKPVAQSSTPTIFTLKPTAPSASLPKISLINPFNLGPKQINAAPSTG